MAASSPSPATALPLAEAAERQRTEDTSKMTPDAYDQMIDLMVAGLRAILAAV